MLSLEPSRLQNLPKPPAFLDPLSSLESSYYYSIPKFHPANHPVTTWLLKRILSHDVESIKRKLELCPTLLQERYFQLVDDPCIYASNSDTDCMFHRKCLLYLTPLAIAIYFKSYEVADVLLSHQPTTETNVAMCEAPQFCSHLQDKVGGDFHAYPIFIIVLRRSVFAAVSLLARCGWRAAQPIAMPLRRRFERRIIYFRDWLDAALSVLQARPNYSLATLVHHVTCTPGYEYIQLPVGAVSAKSKLDPKEVENDDEKSATKKKKKRKDANSVLHQQPGLLEFGNQPPSVPIVGVKNIAELCLMVDTFRQTKNRAKEIRTLMSKAVNNGLHPEVVLTKALDDIQPDLEDRNNNYFADLMRRNQFGGPSNSNNHAASATNEPMQPMQNEHCSEPVRILLCGLERSRFRQLCLDAVAVYVSRRNYFCCSEELGPLDGRIRDLRNFVVTLLNIVASEKTDIDAIETQITPTHPRRRALETLISIKSGVITRVTGILMESLVRTKQIVNFLASAVSFPPYPQDSVDFAINPRLAASMLEICYGVVIHLNAKRDVHKFLNNEILEKAMKDSSISLQLKFGRLPTEAELQKHKSILKETSKESKEQKPIIEK